jgi:hypothetical protein
VIGGREGINPQSPGKARIHSPNSVSLAGTNKPAPAHSDLQLIEICLHRAVTRSALVSLISLDSLRTQ